MGKRKKVKVELFTWEKLDYVSKVKKAFAIKIFRIYKKEKHSGLSAFFVYNNKS